MALFSIDISHTSIFPSCKFIYCYLIHMQSSFWFGIDEGRQERSHYWFSWKAQGWKFEINGTCPHAYPEDKQLLIICMYRWKHITFLLLVNIFIHRFSCLCFPSFISDASLWLVYFMEKLVNNLRYLLMQQVDMGLFGLSPELADTYKYMASMGIYVFKADVLRKLLK